ncbi:MAG: lysophospholipid acyltransferase family protein [Candidatus Scalinduaceae bacterium]
MKKIIHVIYSIYAWFVCLLFWCAGYFIATISAFGLKNKEHKLNAIDRAFTRIALKLIGIKIDIKGLENIPEDEPVIFVSNHQSYLDVKFTIAAIPINFSFISKDVVFKMPILGRFMKASGYISINRFEGRKAYATLNEVVKKLEDGKSIIYFPEGTRSNNGKLGQFKRGISLVILRSGKKVVPTAIIGSGRYVPKGTFIGNPNNRNIRIKFGKALEFPKTEKGDRALSKDVITKIRSEVSKLLYN